jgi:hypothetical protein
MRSVFSDMSYDIQSGIRAKGLQACDLLDQKDEQIKALESSQIDLKLEEIKAKDKQIEQLETNYRLALELNTKLSKALQEGKGK